MRLSTTMNRLFHMPILMLQTTVPHNGTRVPHAAHACGSQGTSLGCAAPNLGIRFVVYGAGFQLVLSTVGKKPKPQDTNTAVCVQHQ